MAETWAANESNRGEKMLFKLIGCQVLTREIERLIARFTRSIAVGMMTMGLHDQEKPMGSHLQLRIGAEANVTVVPSTGRADCTCLNLHAEGGNPDRFANELHKFANQSEDRSEAPAHNLCSLEIWGGVCP